MTPAGERLLDNLTDPHGDPIAIAAYARSNILAIEAEAVAAERARLRADVEGLARDDCPCGCDTLVSRAAVLAAIEGEADR